MALLIVWPYFLERFVVPIVPLMVLACGLGLCLIASRAASQVKVFAIALIAILVVGGQLIEAEQLVRAGRECDRQDRVNSPACLGERGRVFWAMAQWARDSTPRGSVFLTPKEAAFFASAQRTTVNQLVSLQVDPAEWVASLRSRGVTHIAVAPLGANISQLIARAERNCSQLLAEGVPVLECDPETPN